MAKNAIVILVCEIKARTDLQAEDVKVKALAAKRWCRDAAAYNAAEGGKPWYCLLIPHDEVMDNLTLAYLMQFQIRG